MIENCDFFSIHLNDFRCKQFFNFFINLFLQELKESLKWKVIQVHDGFIRKIF